MRRTTLHAHRARISRVVQLLHAHVDEPMRAAEAARLAGLSERQFQRVFTRVMGERFKECIRRLRLERAARQLQHTARSVLEIAIEAGFASHESFLRACRQRFGCLPSEFRRGTPRRSPVIRGSKAETLRFVFAAGLRRHLEATAESCRGNAGGSESAVLAETAIREGK